jgi:hypothetical protein
MMRKWSVCLLSICACVAVIVACGASGTSSDELIADDVRASFQGAINGRGFRDSLQLDEILGVCQESNHATVFFAISGIEGGRGTAIHGEVHSASCFKFTDGRWYCTLALDEYRLTTSFFLQQPDKQQ